jgi:hypothetical protein
MAGLTMTEAEGTSVNTEQFLEFLPGLAWCKQGTDVLVAVSKATPEIIDLMLDNELRVFPGNMVVKIQKSTVHHMRQQYDEGQPLPVVVVWKRTGVEIWYRKHNPNEFPYDSWTSDAGAAYERERIFVPAEKLGANHGALQAAQCEKAKECPTMIPAY